MASPMRILATYKDGHTSVRLLVAHPMETGLRRHPQGYFIAAHFIQRLTATCQGRTVLSAQWGSAVSQNPFLSFRFKGGAVGERIVVTWVDNRKDVRTDEAVIAAYGADEADE